MPTDAKPEEQAAGAEPLLADIAADKAVANTPTGSGTSEPPEDLASPAYEPLAQDFSLPQEAISRSGLSPKETINGTPANYHAELPSPVGGGSPVKRVGLIAAGGLAGVAAGFYLLSLFGGIQPDQLDTSVIAEATEPPPIEPPTPLAGLPAADTGQPAVETIDPVATAINNTKKAIDDRRVEQASFERPAQPPRAAVEPVEEKPIALWAWMEDTPRFSMDQLSAALEGAGDAAATLNQYTLSDENGLKQIGVGYAKLCELAQVVSLLDTDASHSNMMVKRLEAKSLYGKLFRSAHVRGDSRTIASRWIAWPGRPHGGVFFSGVPEPARRVGEGLYQHDFKFEDGATVSLVTPELFRLRRFKKADEMLIIGCVIESPRDRLPGYEGDAERVVWRATSIALKAPSLP